MTGQKQQEIAKCTLKKTESQPTSADEQHRREAHDGAQSSQQPARCQPNNTSRTTLWWPLAASQHHALPYNYLAIHNVAG